MGCKIGMVDERGRRGERGRGEWKGRKEGRSWTLSEEYTQGVQEQGEGEEGERGRWGIGGDWEGRGGLGTGKETLFEEKGDGDRGRCVKGADCLGTGASPRLEGDRGR